LVLILERTPVRLAEIERRFLADGAHLVIRSVAELPERLEELAARGC
jgi:hypothetical protein